MEKRKKKEEEKRKQKEIKAQSDLRKELLKKEIKEEKAIAKTRTIELKSFLREEQKLIREKEKIKQEKFLEEVRLEKTLEKFRKRELSEIQAIEKYTLNIEKEDFKAFQQRIDQVREKYKALRNERLRKRVEELGVTLSDQATAEEIRQKEKEYIQSVIKADFAEAGDEDVFRKIKDDLKNHNILDEDIRKKMNELNEKAKTDFK